MTVPSSSGPGWAGEIASLTPESFDLNADPPTVTVRGAYSKHRREDVQPMRRDLAERLRPWLVGRVLRAPIFDTPRLSDKTGRLIREDLTAAGVPYEDEDGRFADFHSLRVSFVSAVVRAGASPKEAQTLARHADPSLTFKVYAKARMHDLTRALEAMPGVSTGDEATSATGTGDASPHQIPHHSARDRAHTVAKRCDDGDATTSRRVGVTSDRLRTCASVDDASRGKELARPGGLEPPTCGLEIRSPDSEHAERNGVTSLESGAPAEAPAVGCTDDPLAALPDDQRATVRALLDLPADRRAAVLQAVRLMFGGQ